jgi:hypothetical protein
MESFEEESEMGDTFRDNTRFKGKRNGGTLQALQQEGSIKLKSISHLSFENVSNIQFCVDGAVGEIFIHLTNI